MGGKLIKKPIENENIEAIKNVVSNNLQQRDQVSAINKIRVNKKSKSYFAMLKIKNQKKELQKKLQNMETNSYEKKEMKNNKIISKFYQKYKKKQR